MEVHILVNFCLEVDSVDHNLITGCACFCHFSLGRRPTVLLSHIAYFLGGLLTLFSPYFWLIGISRFMVGMAHHTVSHLPYLIGKTASIIKTLETYLADAQVIFFMHDGFSTKRHK